MLAIRNDRVYRPKNPGAHADGPTLPGGRSTFPKKSRGAGALDWTGRGFFGFGGALGAAVPSGETDADGVSPFACSRPTSRRGHANVSILDPSLNLLLSLFLLSRFNAAFSSSQTIGLVLMSFPSLPMR